MAEFKIGRLRFNWDGEWESARFYNRDAVIQYNGKMYVCLIPNTSSSNFYDDLNHVTPGGAITPYWNLVIDGTTWKSLWEPSTQYSLGNLVSFGGVVYICTEAHESGLTTIDLAKFDTYATFANWNATWTTNRAYGIGDVVKYGGIVYVCNTNHISASTTNLGLEDDISLWTALNLGIEYKGTWSSSVKYKLNDIVKLNASLYIANVGHPPSGTFPDADWDVWLPGESFIGTWSAGTVYQLGDTVIYGGYNYVSISNNNQGIVPSTDSETNWELLFIGYRFENDWNNNTSYKIGNVVRRGGNLYEAISDSYNQDPAFASIIKTYDEAGSSGTTIAIGSTTNIVAGMTVIGAGFDGQTVEEIVAAGVIRVSSAPSSLIVDGETLYFVGVNYLYWEILSPGTVWANTWTISTSYLVGTLVKWKNGTYKCIQNHTSSTPYRPDNDVSNQFWIFYIPNARKNALTTVGDLESFVNGEYAAVPVGTDTDTYTLRVTNATPTWQHINAVPAVYYVSTYNGIDQLTENYGQTWDKPWKTIKFACDTIAAGAQNFEEAEVLRANKAWMIEEMYQWMLYQVAEEISPFDQDSVFDEEKTRRDAGYIIDALVYDITRGGNSQIVAATLAYFSTQAPGTFVTPEVAIQMPWYIAALTKLRSLINYSILNTQADSNYQEINEVPTIDVVPRTIISGYTLNPDTQAQILVLNDILLDALSAQSTDNVPAANDSATASIMVKTGTYAEQLPIVVPANVAVCGDELRSTVVTPLTAISLRCTATVAIGNRIIVTSTTGLTEAMPIQFDANLVFNVSQQFGNIIAGNTYYVIGSSILPTSFSVATTTTRYTATADVIANQSTIVVSDTTDFAVNAYVSGPGIPVGSRVIAVDTLNSTITLSNTPTISGNSVLLTFSSASYTVSSATGSMYVYGGDCLNDMFRLRNGSGLRNMTLTGLLGTLGLEDEFTIRRPTGGSFACLDPGEGPDDTSAWIYRRSPYVQNVTAFGTGCAALKIDGTLHNGGNRSIVANDFTHILSDGIGVWCTGTEAKTEVISVFSYYGYAGYFADGGGRIRAANGNSSYGTYGVVSTGYDVTEIPVTGTVYNKSTQTQAQVQSAFGSTAELIKINYANAGSEYDVSTTNLLKYSNNFLDSSWTSDGNLSFAKITEAPTGLNEAWSFTGTTSTTGQGYIYQNIPVTPKGQIYTALSAVNISGGGSTATFNVTVTSSGYLVDVNFGGTGYAVTNQLYIAGGQLGGRNNVNDCIITVTGLGGSSINAVTVTGVVPTGSDLDYTFSTYIKEGTSPSIDIYGIFSGSSTVTSSINYNFNTGVITPSNATGGFLPTEYGIEVTLAEGWYRLWFAAHDTTGLNNNLEFRIYPRGYTGTASDYTYFYGTQLELSNVIWLSYAPSFYLETTSSTYTAYANYNVSGAGTDAVAVGDEIRSNSIFETRLTDPGSGAGGSGYLTASNNGQSGTSSYIQLAQSDNNAASNYTGMRLFINSGTGAGQYGYISSYDEEFKIAQILKESFDSLQIISTTRGVATGNASNITGTTLTIGGVVTGTWAIGMTLTGSGITPGTYITGYVSGSGAGSVWTVSASQSVSASITGTNNVFAVSGGGIDTIYSGQAVQFIPTYYTTSVTSTSLAQTTVTEAVGGTSNTLTVASTAGMKVNMAITFTGSTFSTVTSGFTYYIYSIEDDTTIKISSQLFGNIWTLTSGTGSMTLNFTSNTSYLTAATTSMKVNYPIQFTGTALGGLSVGNTYYINEIVDATHFSIATSLVDVTVTATNPSNSGLSVTSTASLIPLNPIVFTDPVVGNIVDGTKYYISKIIDSGTFSVSSTIITRPATVTVAASDLITTSSTAGFVVNNPIQFVGTSFGGITAETIYYILVINDGFTFSISQTPGGGAVSLTDAIGSLTIRTCPVADTLSSSSGASMPGTSTSTKTTLSLGIGAMNGTFSTALFGNVSLGTTYYINSIDENNTKLTVSETLGGDVFTVAAKTGSMNLAAVGWDHINPGTPVEESLDNSTVYFVEPRTAYSEPTFAQTSGAPVTLSVGTSWISIAYGDHYWMALPSGNSTAAGSRNGSTWDEITLPSVQSWTGIAYGNGYWVAISSGGSGNSKAIYSNSNGLGWRTVNLPSATTWSNIAYGIGVFVAIATGTSTSAYSLDYGKTWASGSSLPSGTWTGLCYGKGKFVAVASGGTTAAYSTDGQTWVSTTLPSSTAWSSIAYGNNRFVAISSSSNKTAYSFDAITWYESEISISGTEIEYGQGIFLVVSSANGTAYTSDSGLIWKKRLITNDGYTAIKFGITDSIIIERPGYFATLAGAGTGSRITAGVRAKARPIITSGVITGLSEWEPGSAYTAIPTVTFTDPNITALATVTPRISNGTLASPTFINNGSGYSTASTAVRITGNGYANTYQTGLSIILNNLTSLPQPGDNLTFEGIDQIYKVTSASSVFGTSTPNLEANVQISPDMSVALSPEDGVLISIRTKYSQARLTNHDFLNIGYGDFETSNYPGIPDTGYTATQQNQVIEVNFGRVFYTSTDQDGNFKVGNLFGVQQATGIVTLSASQFGLTGLETLSLGGISVGGSSVVVTQFSTDPTFTANSDSVIPTQRSIKAYLEGRLSQGGSNTFTGQLIAGTVFVGNPDQIGSTVPNGQAGSVINMPGHVVMSGSNSGIDGDLVALDFFVRGFTRR